jgi:hypothetical protein
MSWAMLYMAVERLKWVHERGKSITHEYDIPLSIYRVCIITYFLGSWLRISAIPNDAES